METETLQETVNRIDSKKPETREEKCQWFIDFWIEACQSNKTIKQLKYRSSDIPIRTLSLSGNTSFIELIERGSKCYLICLGEMLNIDHILLNSQDYIKMIEAWEIKDSHKKQDILDYKKRL